MINLKTKKIIVPYDFSDVANNAVNLAAYIASITKGELILVFIEKNNEILNIILPSLSIIKPSIISGYLSETLTSEAKKIEKITILK